MLKVHRVVGLRCHLISYLRQKVGNKDEVSQLSVASVWLDGRKEQPQDRDFLGNRIHGYFPSPGLFGRGLQAERW